MFTQYFCNIFLFTANVKCGYIHPDFQVYLNNCKEKWDINIYIKQNLNICSVCCYNTCMYNSSSHESTYKITLWKYKSIENISSSWSSLLLCVFLSSSRVCLYIYIFAHKIIHFFTYTIVWNTWNIIFVQYMIETNEKEKEKNVS